MAPSSRPTPIGFKIANISILDERLYHLLCCHVSLASMEQAQFLSPIRIYLNLLRNRLMQVCCIL